MAAHQGGPEVTLIESDARKAAFLREASRVCSAGATIVNARVEAVGVPEADVVTARACAPLPRLLHEMEDEHALMRKVERSERFIGEDPVWLARQHTRQ